MHIMSTSYGGSGGGSGVGGGAGALGPVARRNDLAVTAQVPWRTPPLLRGARDDAASLTLPQRQRSPPIPAQYSPEELAARPARAFIPFGTKVQRPRGWQERSAEKEKLWREMLGLSVSESEVQ